MSDGQSDLLIEDARSLARKVIYKLGGLDDPADESQFVEEVLRSVGIDPTKTIFITVNADDSSGDPLPERVLLPPTTDQRQRETVRLMLKVGDDLRDSNLTRHELNPHQSKVSLLARLRNRITTLW